MGAEIVTVSTDSKFVHLAWRRHEKALEGVRYPMGADPTGTLSRLFGVYDPSLGEAMRGTFLISPDGVLFASEVTYHEMGRNIDELIRKFKASIYLSRKKDEACPSKWRDEGDKTLKPSAKIVGRVHEAMQD